MDKKNRAEQAREILAAQAAEPGGDPAPSIAYGPRSSPQMLFSMEQSSLRMGGYDYQTSAFVSNGVQRTTRVTHIGADDYLGYAQDSVNRFTGEMDDIASAAGASRGSQIYAAATYGLRKIAGDTVNGIIGIPRLMTSNSMVPGIVNAAMNPQRTAVSMVNQFGAMSFQDKLVTGLEVALPFKGSIESLAERLTRRSVTGLDAAAASAKFQGDYPYLGVDILENTSLPTGRQVVQLTHSVDGSPASSYFTTLDALEGTRLPDGTFDANALHQGLQTYPGTRPNFRSFAQVYEVVDDVPHGGAAIGPTTANPYFNPGQFPTLEQIYLQPEFHGNLRPTQLYNLSNTRTPSYTPMNEILNNMLRSDTH